MGCFVPISLFLITFMELLIFHVEHIFFLKKTMEIILTVHTNKSVYYGFGEESLYIEKKKKA